MFYLPSSRLGACGVAKWVVRQAIYLAIVLTVLYFAANKLAHGADLNYPAAPLPHFLLSPEAKAEAISGSKPRTSNKLQINAAGRPSYKDNPKWIAYQERRKARKKYALQKRAAYNNSKNWSRVALSHHIPIDISNPLGINPWSNYRGNARFNRRPTSRLPIIPWVPDADILSPGDLIQ